ncbi:TolC family protein [Nannocystis pusilla]|uniref:TolC family protein n=1 Tax=Nannocystis pusilla TaxID=889268 RepID=UPI003B7988AE
MSIVGCASAPAVSPERAIATWREMQVGQPRGALPESTAAALAGGDALTVEQAYALALANNPELAVVEARAEVATAEIGAARQLQNPSVRVSNVGVDDSAPGRIGFNMGLRAPIPDPAACARADAARHAAAGAHGEAEAARRQCGRRCIDCSRAWPGSPPTSRRCRARCRCARSGSASSRPGWPARWRPRSRWRWPRWPAPRRPTRSASCAPSWPAWRPSWREWSGRGRRSACASTGPSSTSTRWCSTRRR